VTASLAAAPTAGSPEAECYVFGVVDAGTRLRAPLEVGLASGLRLVEHGAVAALVGAPPPERALGRASDLVDHDRVLADLASGGVAVVPLRFGTLLPDDATVVAELLEPRHDELRRLLDVVRDRVQFTLTARFERDTVLREVLEDNADIQRLRAAADDGMGSRLALGERVVGELMTLRDGEAAALLTEIEPVVAGQERQTSDPLDVARVSVLVELADAAAFEQRLEEAARRRAGRVTVRLVGPSAAYDFLDGG